MATGTGRGVQSVTSGTVGRMDRPGLFRGRVIGSVKAVETTTLHTVWPATGVRLPDRCQAHLDVGVGNVLFLLPEG